MAQSYFEWLQESTPTRWWHDSAIPEEIDAALSRGAMGITTNPVLTYKAFQADPEYWADSVSALPATLDFETRAESLLQIVTQAAARQVAPHFIPSEKKHGYALGQLNPNNAGNAEKMLPQARRIHAWGDNIAIKLPATNAGLEVMEVLAEEGIPICATINCSVAQALAVARVYEAGRARALAKGVTPSLCIVVQQLGRIDDYLRDVAMDMHAHVEENDIKQAGLAVAKRSYQIFQKEGYHATIMPSALRGAYHLTELAGGAFTFSIHPRAQEIILAEDPAKEARIDRPIDPAAIARLSSIPEFVRAYEPDGMEPPEFIRFGVTQKLLSQFVETGWSMLETYGSSIQNSRWT